MTEHQELIAALARQTQAIEAAAKAMAAKERPV
jgi:hypothetical protein